MKSVVWEMLPSFQYWQSYNSLKQEVERFSWQIFVTIGILETFQRSVAIAFVRLNALQTA